jgi:hypothetical protein
MNESFPSDMGVKPSQMGDTQGIAGIGSGYDTQAQIRVSPVFTKERCRNG